MSPGNKAALIITVFLLRESGAFGQNIDSLKAAGDYYAVLKTHEEELALDLRSGNIKNQCKDYNNIANAYRLMGKYEISTRNYFKALKLAEKERDKSLEASIFYNIGMNYATIHDSSARRYLKAALAFFDGDDMNTGKCYEVLGCIEADYNRASNYFKNAETAFKKMNARNEIANVYVNSAYLELGEGHYDLAEQNSRKSLSIFKETGDRAGIASSYVNINAAKFGIGENLKDENRTGVLKACLALLDSAQMAIQGVNIPSYLIVIYQSKANLFNLLGKSDSAYAYLSRYQLLNDSVNNVTKIKQVQELKIEYESEKKEQEIERLKQEKRVTSLYIITIGISVLFALALLTIFVIRTRNKKKQQLLEFEKSKLEYEQQALRAQMNPHFIFNAINSIQKYILSKNEREAYDYLAKFAKLIRIVLNNSREKSLMLQQELEMINLYVELEQIRFSNKFEFKIDVDESVNDDDMMVPAMLIQPYVENAIWHGLMNLPKDRKGILKLSVSHTEKSLKIVIEDNGIGRAKAKQFKSEDKHRSVGMALTEQRLMMINQMEEYEKAKVEVTDLCENDRASGTRVEITLLVK